MASPLAQALMAGDVNAALPEAYQNPNVGLAPHIARMIESLMSLPRRAVEASKADVALYQQHGFGGTEYVPQTIGPATEAAMMVTGGAGAIPAETNSLRAGLRPYQNVPDPLMGFRKSGAQRGFEESRYPHTQDVEVVLPPTSVGPRDIFSDQIKGMNPDHALERAWRNWPDAIHIFSPNRT